MDVRYVLADVFTDRPFSGNQLAVIPDARDLSDRAMQAIAREFNFSESTFVLPAVNPAHQCNVRIFTPSREVEFAGHPTVGTAAVLVHEGRIELVGGSAQVVLEELAGPLRVDIDVAGTKLFTRFAVERPLQTAPGPAREAMAAVLSLERAAVIDSWFASLGLPFCFVHLVDRGEVDRAEIDKVAWSLHLASAWAPDIFLFAHDAHTSNRLYARMFAPGFGIDEDPATGSAAAALAARLAEGASLGDGVLAWTIDQGVAMGRPSVIAASAEKAAGRTTRVLIGGQTVVVGRGTLMVPDGYS